MYVFLPKQGRILHDIYQFATEYATTSTRSKRSLTGYTLESAYCPYQNQTITCSSSNKYRSYDGTCNNLNNPLIGSINTPYTRFLPASYQDGVDSQITLSVTGQPLPNPRNISLTISRPSPVQKLSNTITHLFPLFGQFLAHDLVGTSTTTGV